MSTTATSPAPESTGRLLLIDGHSMAFRAFYALPVDSFTTSTGQTTNAVHGFVSMFLSLIEQEEPTHVAVAFDLPGGTFRTQEYAEYKGTRDETPAPFIGQVELIEDVLKAMNVRALTASGYEADDILATLAASAQAEGMEVLVCSGDRDSFQTVTDRCTVLYPIKGVSTLRRMTPGEVEDRYGVPPQRYPQLAALVGEPSDNLPGVPGVGPKTAAKWINLYDGLDGVIAHADRIKGKAGQSLRDHVGDVVRNRRLNRLVTNLDLDVAPTADLILRAADRAELARVMDALEFRTLYQRAQRILTFSEDAEGPDNNADGTGQESPAARLESLDVAVLGRDITLGSLGQWLRDNLGIITDSKEIEALAASVEDNGGAYFVPAFSGLFAPHWRPDARGALVGLTRYVNKAHIARAVEESTAFQTREVLEAMNADSGQALTELKVDGGMTRDELLMQFQADQVGVPVVRPKVAETTALGAAYASGIAVGFWSGTQDVIDNWAEDKRWEPTMEEAERERLFRNWNKAVQRTLDWVDEDVVE